MKIDWSLLFVIFLAIVLARIFEKALLHGNSTEGTLVGAEIHSPAEPTVTFANPIEEYISKKYPGAYR